MLNLKNALEKQGINPSYQRLKILEYLLNNKTHPNADTIYKDLSKEITTLSKTTVYNTLKTFHEKKIILALMIEEKEVRYDAAITFHAHLKCAKCDKIYDVNLNSPIVINDTYEGHKITESQIYLRGTCQNCLNNE